MPDNAYPLPFETSADLLRRYQIPVARMKLIHNAALLEAAVAEMGYPVALKAISPAFSHKSDHNLVRLGLATPQALQGAAQEMTSILAGQPFEGFLLQEMVTGAIEVIAGITCDEQFGPLVVFGSGGTLVELFDDAVMRVPPLTSRQARQMIAETRAERLLMGYRGAPEADFAALVDLLRSLGSLALEQKNWLGSLDLNPVMVLPAGQGVKVCDYRIFSRTVPDPQLLQGEVTHDEAR